MEVKRAEHAGFCKGIARALELAREAIEKNPPPNNVAMLGELTHNPGAVAELEAQGARVVDSIDEVDSGTVITRAHGVPPEVITAAEAKGLEVVDTTCKRVKTVQKIVRWLSENDYTVVIVGEPEHPEVVSVKARAGDNAIVIQSPDDLPSDFSSNAQIGVVSQTTQTAEAFDAVVDTLKDRGIVPKVYKTRCNATKERQDAAIELAKRVDVMLVIGGPKSSNTAKLAEVSREFCSETYLIQGPDDVNSAWFNGVESVGITAGASTPEEQIFAVENHLRTIFS